MLQLSPPIVYVHSFSQLSKLAQLAGDKKLEEIRACLEGMITTAWDLKLIYILRAPPPAYSHYPFNYNVIGNLLHLSI